MAAIRDFEMFVGEAEPRLRRALVAAYGSDVGVEATAEALAWAWEHWARVARMGNPVGFLYRVGQSRARRHLGVRVVGRSDRPVYDAPTDVDLARALEHLSPRQRAAVVLVHGHGYTLADAAGALGCSVSSLRNHLRRALRHLHAELEVIHVDH